MKKTGVVVIRQTNKDGKDRRQRGRGRYIQSDLRKPGNETAGRGGKGDLGGGGGGGAGRAVEGYEEDEKKERESERDKAWDKNKKKEGIERREIE